MKISVSTYSFSQLLNDSRMTQLDCITKAKEMGFDGIEFAEITPPDGIPTDEYARMLAKEASRLDLPITAFATGADFLTGSNGNCKIEIERVKKQVDLAALLGVSVMRHDVTSGFAPATRGFRGFDDVLPLLASACREVTEYAAGYGIRTMVENHGFFCQDSDRVERLINTVAHSNFGWLVDMGNFLCADENPVTAVGRAAPYAFHVHAKDFHLKSGMEPDPGEGFFRSRGGQYLRGAVLGQGAVPVKQCITTLSKSGYNGYVTIEFEGMEQALQGIRIGLSNLRRYITEA